MKTNVLTIFFLFYSIFSGSSQEMKIALASNFEARDQVIKLEIQQGEDIILFKLGIVKDNLVYFTNFYARKGTHYYSLRDLDQWEGAIDYLVTNLDQNKLKSYGLVESNFNKELDVFLDEDIFTPSIVNLVKQKTVFGYPFTLLLGLVSIFFSAIVYFFKRHIIVAIFAAILIVTSINDLRMALNHLRIMQTIEKDDLLINPISFAQPFATHIAPLIKQGKWTFEGNLPNEYFRVYFKYQFADVPIVPGYVRPIPVDTYSITTDQPKDNQKVIHAEDGFYLLQQK